MLKMRRGFTMVEVALFLAITGLLFAGVTVGVQNSIFQQRFVDSTQNFAEFLRSAYSGVTNVQNTHGGRSDRAIYGKLIIFKNVSGKNEIYMYDVTGNVNGTYGNNIIETLDSLEAKAEGMIEKYVPRWGSSIEKLDEFSPYTGSLLIVRHPRTGVVNTLVSKNVVDVGDGIVWENVGFVELRDVESVENVNFCINPTAGEARSNRRDVVIEKGARSGSAVKIIATDGEDNKCNK